MTLSLPVPFLCAAVLHRDAAGLRAQAADADAAASVRTIVPRTRVSLHAARMFVRSVLPFAMRVPS
ncbi:hypothetical protein [Paraburkholderia caballeronis]|uniref:hypothetical protein n=1 Tax=Paraburkholderia caballeronis TaxID=416943 RepID=UPI001066A9BA|nr:hypothetical protein [Paraburkholderia caballeronis]